MRIVVAHTNVPVQTTLTELFIHFFFKTKHNVFTSTKPNQLINKLTKYRLKIKLDIKLNIELG